MSQVLLIYEREVTDYLLFDEDEYILLKTFDRFSQTFNRRSLEFDGVTFNPPYLDDVEDVPLTEEESAVLINLGIANGENMLSDIMDTLRQQYGEYTGGLIAVAKDLSKNFATLFEASTKRMNKENLDALLESFVTLLKRYETDRKNADIRKEIEDRVDEIYELLQQYDSEMSYEREELEQFIEMQLARFNL